MKTTPASRHSMLMLSQNTTVHTKGNQNFPVHPFRKPPLTQNLQYEHDHSHALQSYFCIHTDNTVMPTLPYKAPPGDNVESETALTKEFKSCLRNYEGIPTRIIPDTMLQDLRSYIDTLSHLVDKHAQTTVERYRGITRVHIHGMLKSRAKWRRYLRDSNFIHSQITQQAPPNISHIKNTLLFLFGIGILPFFILFLFNVPGILD